MKKIYSSLLMLLISWQGFTQATSCVTLSSSTITNLTSSGGNCTFTFTPTVTVTNKQDPKIASFIFTAGGTTVTVCYTGNATSTTAVLMTNCSDARNTLPPGTYTLPPATITLPCGATASLTAQNSNSGDGGFCTNSTPLNLGSFPVRLADFSVTLKDNIGHLNWATTEELNNKGFEVQKSINAQDFQAIGFVEGAGTLQARKEYSYRDYNFNTTSYYRLKQVDLDGSYSFSRVVSLIPTNESVEVITLSPNPTQQKVSITLPRNITSMRIVNSQGVVVKEAQYDENTLQTEADVAGLQAGIYYVEFKTPIEKSTKRLVINP